MAGINIVLNGEGREVPTDINLDQLLELFSLPKQRVAIEINHTVISRTDWPRRQVNDGDKIEVVHFVGGG